MKHHRAALLALALSACASTHDANSAALLAADRAFCADTQARRIEGWVAAFDASGSQVDDRFRPVTGAAAIRAHMQGFFAEAQNELSWQPDAARIAEGGGLGTTTGRFRLSRKRPDGSSEVLAQGRYFDIWRKQADGTWKLLYDVGEADAPKS